MTQLVSLPSCEHFRTPRLYSFLSALPRESSTCKCSLWPPHPHHPGKAEGGEIDVRSNKYLIIIIKGEAEAVDCGERTSFDSSISSFPSLLASKKLTAHAAAAAAKSSAVTAVAVVVVVVRSISPCQRTKGRYRRDG